MRAMPHYTIELIPRGDDKPDLHGIRDREERRFANLGEALERAREMHRWQNASAKGFRIFNAKAELVHEWTLRARHGPTPGRLR